MKSFETKAYHEFKQQHPSVTISFDEFCLMAWKYGTIELEKMATKEFEAKLYELKVKNSEPVETVSPQHFGTLTVGHMDPKDSQPKPSLNSEKINVNVGG